MPQYSLDTLRQFAGHLNINNETQNTMIEKEDKVNISMIKNILP